MFIIRYSLLVFIFQCAESLVEKETCETPLGEKSECVKLWSCDPMVKFVLDAPRPYSDEFRKTIDQFVCEYKNEFEDFLICCPSQPINIDKEGNIVGSASSPQNVESHQNLKYLPQDCGFIDDGSKILGGTNADLMEFPWMATLLYRKDGKLVPRCGGTILNRNYILTAAHCLVDALLPFVGVRVGEHSLLSETDCVEIGDKQKKCNSPVQHLIAEKIIIHPDFNDTGYFSNDIALLRVTKMNFEDNVQPICLPTHENILNQNFNDGIVSGWGYTDPSGDNVVDILQKVNLKRQNMSFCETAYKNNPQVKLPINLSKTLCIGGEAGKDSCRGDSGSPFQVAAYVDDDARFFQRGIVSLGHIECGKKGFPAIYTNVDYYLKWILDSIYL